MKKKDVEARIAELSTLTTQALRYEHYKVWGWEPLFEGRREMIEKLSAHLREQADQQDSTTNTDEKE